MHDSDSGIGINSGMIPIFAEIGIGIKNIKIKWNWLESESELESDFWVNLESESHMGRNRASLIETKKKKNWSWLG